MIKFLEADGTLTFMVQVVPRAARSEIVGEHNGALRVRIAAPPVDGAANEELIRILSRAFKLPRSAFKITAGRAARLKHLRVVGASGNALETLASKVS